VKGEFIAEIISGGRITVPEKIRKLLSLVDGDFVEISLTKINRKTVSVEASS